MISVVIPVYKNKEQLLRNIHHNLRYLKNCEIIIVNDYPSESFHKELEDIKSVKILTNERNLGFGLAVNRGVVSATHKHILLLNSDVLLHDTSYRLALPYFDQHEVFAVSFAQKEQNGSVVGKNSFFWRNGLFFHEKSRDNTLGINGWAEGGTCMIDRNKFLKLGGFDQLYFPFYWEDIDLSYRAWKMGYKILYDPDIHVEHHHASTISTYFTSSYIRNVSFRNQFIFIWKNITDNQLIFSHLLYLLPNVIYYLLKQEYAFIRGFTQALPKIRRVIEKRNYDRKSIVKSDKEILNQFI